MQINTNTSNDIATSLLKQPVPQALSQRTSEESAITDSLQRLTDPSIQGGEGEITGEQANDMVNLLQLAMNQQPGQAMAAQASSMSSSALSLL